MCCQDAWLLKPLSLFQKLPKAIYLRDSAEWEGERVAVVSPKCFLYDEWSFFSPWAALSPRSQFTLTYAQSAKEHKLSLQCKDISGNNLYIN